MKLSVSGLGLAGGILWGLACFLVGLISSASTYGDVFVSMVGSIYPGYTDTVAGSFIGLVWGFVDGLVCGILLAWLYNRFVGNRIA